MIRLKHLLQEITLDTVAPYATQFVWTPERNSVRETQFQADDITITLIMTIDGKADLNQWIMTMLTPTPSGGVTASRSRSAAVGRIDYLRLMHTVGEALIDFVTQYQPVSVDVTGYEASNAAKSEQKTRIYRALLQSNAMRITVAGYRVLDNAGGLWLVRKSVATHELPSHIMMPA